MKTKNLIFTTLFILCFSSNMALAQKKKTNSKSKPTKSYSRGLKGKWEVGGNLNLDFDNGGTNTGLNATIAYYISNKTQLGARFGTSFQTGASVFSGGVFGKYFINQFYVGAGADYTRISFNNSTVFGFLNIKPVNLIGATLDGGYRVPIGKNLKLDTGLSLNIPISPTGYNTNLSIHGGVVYAF